MKRVKVISVFPTLAFVMSFQASGQFYSEVRNLQSNSIVDWPCQGTTLLDEDFNSGLPGTWTILDADSLQPVAALNLAMGWQSIPDFIDTNNTVMASPSWYSPAGKSDDWLILPSVTLGSNPCISWRAHSQDPLFPESYEVRISTTTSDTSAFLLNPPLDTIPAEGGERIFRVIHPDAYAGQTIRIAFRQITSDGFVLVLDSFRIAEISDTDAGIVDMDSIFPEALAATVIALTVINAGTDTIDSAELNWSVDGGSVQSMSLDSMNLAPNFSVPVPHSLTWTPDTIGNFQLCTWTSNPNGSGDDDMSNDTLCRMISVNQFVSRDRMIIPMHFSVTPNPFRDWIRFGSRYSDRISDIIISDMLGKPVANFQAVGSVTIDLHDLPAGIYILNCTTMGENQSGRLTLMKE